MRADRVFLVGLLVGPASALFACNGILGTVDLDYEASDGAVVDGAPSANGDDDATALDGTDAANVNQSRDGAADASSNPSDAGNDDATGDGGDASAGDAAALCPYTSCPCTTGDCQPVPLAAFPDLQDLGADDQYVYVAAGHQGLVGITKTTDGGIGTKKVLYAPDGGVFQVTAGAGYVAVENATQVVEVVPGTGATTPLFAAQEHSDQSHTPWLVSNAQYVAQLQNAGVAVGGPATKPIVIGSSSPTALSLGANSVYLTDEEGVKRFTPTGTQMATYGFTGQGNGLLADDANVYFTTSAGNDLRVASLDLTSVTSIPDATYVYVMARRGPYLYWLDNDGPYRCLAPTCAGGAAHLFDTSDLMSALLVDDDAMYVVVSDDNDNGATVERISLH